MHEGSPAVATNRYISISTAQDGGVRQEFTLAAACCNRGARRLGCQHPNRERSHTMSNHVYKLLELTGSSTTSIEDAVQNAIEKASETVRNIHWFTITETRGHVDNGKIAHWQVSLKLGFTLE